jgi:hypothetical protein
MFKIFFILSSLTVCSANAMLPVNNTNIDQSSHVDVRLYKTNCDARWKFERYIKCLDESRLIPGVRASYFTLRGRARFYQYSKLEGAEACRSLLKLNKSNFNACINKFVAHKAQRLGSGESNNFGSLNFMSSTGSIE